MTFDDLPDPRWRRRSRLQLEHDVLAAMFLIEPFRREARKLLRAADFTSSTHVALWQATEHDLAPGQAQFVAELQVAPAIGCNVTQAERWLAGSSPYSYEADLALLVDCR